MEAWVGDALFVFDGTVLEIFGLLFATQIVGKSPSMRFHVSNMKVEVEDPDRKGRRRVRISMRSSIAGASLEIEEGDWPAISGVLDQVRAALPA